MTEHYTQNASGFKNSCEKYRIINGVRFIMWSYETDKFNQLKAQAKNQGLKTRIINNELYLEVKSCDQ